MSNDTVIKKNMGIPSGWWLLVKKGEGVPWNSLYEKVVNLTSNTTRRVWILICILLLPKNTIAGETIAEFIPIIPSSGWIVIQ
jgi:ABC-type methionine transport system permease subunit